jgi:hypothetical protein
MDHVCRIFPSLPGKTVDTRAFQQELDTNHKAEYALSEGRLGIPREHRSNAELPIGDLLIGVLDAPKAGATIGQFVQSKDAFDLWFKQRVTDVIGVDLNNPPTDMKLPELVSTFEA